MGAALVVSTFVLAGCGTSVPSSGEGSTTTAKTATTERPTDTTAPPTTDDPVANTVRELRKLLPTVDQIGEDYRVDSSSDDGDDPAMDAAMRKACPDADALLESDAGDGPSAKRSFGTEDLRNVEVKLEPGASLTSKAKEDVELDELISAVNDCDVIKYSDDDGVSFEIELEVEKDTDYGDQGIAMIMRMLVTDKSLPKPVKMEGGFRKFMVGDVGVSVSAMSGFDSNTMKEVDGDFELINSLSEQLEQGVADLQRRD